MFIRFSSFNTTLWSFFSLVPAARLLLLGPRQRVGRAKSLNLTSPYLFLRQSILFTRLGSILNPTQLVELYSTHLSRARKFGTSVSFFSPQRVLFYSFFFFSRLTKLTKKPLKAYLSTCSYSGPHSIDFIYDAAWWLEREAAEGVGIFFFFKEDGRNLLLEYSNVFKPLLKTFPTYGFFELHYNSFLCFLEARRLNLQQS